MNHKKKRVIIVRGVFAISCLVLLSLSYALLYYYIVDINWKTKRDLKLKGCLVSETEVGIFLYPPQIRTVFLYKSLDWDVFNVLQSSKSLQVLRIENASIDMVVFARLLEACSIDTLYISGSSFCDSDIANYSFAFSRIKYLCIKDSLLSDDALISFASFPQLISITQTGNLFTTNGLAEFKKLRPSVQVINEKYP